MNRTAFNLVPAAARALAAFAVVTVTAATVQVAAQESHHAVVTSAESFSHGAAPVQLPTVVIVAKRDASAKA